MLFRSLLDPRKPRVAPRRRAACLLRLEPLEDRSLPAGFLQTNLAADIPGVAQVHDPELVDAWGISINPNGTFWVSARATDVSTVYSGDVTPEGGSFRPFVKSALTVTVPGGAPTGQVFNGSNDFVVSAGGVSAPARFIFASETGHITGWNATVPSPPAPSRTAHIMATTPGAVYTGLAIGNNGAGNFLYAADFANRRIDVFDGTYTPTDPAGDFVDPGIPADYAPFNIWNLGGKLYVAYAKQDNGDALPDGGHGFVSTFDFDGNFLDRVVTKDHLKEPWGLALAPADFGELSNALLVGNLGNGKINAYDPATGEFLGRLSDPNGEAIHIDGLLGLHFGNGTVSGDSNALYFAAAPKKHAHGLFGSLRVAPDAAEGGTAGFSRDDGSDPPLPMGLFGPDILGTNSQDRREVIPAGRGAVSEAPDGEFPVSGQLRVDDSSPFGGVDLITAGAEDSDPMMGLVSRFAIDLRFGNEAFTVWGIPR